jgi:sirohydrochlorin ferrochelatase
LAEPSIRDAFGSCVEQGANRVIVSPFFLLPGRHWHKVAKFAFLWELDYESNRELITIIFIYIQNRLRKPGRLFILFVILQDIPSLAAEAAKEHPNVSYIVTAPLGLHDLLVV